MEKEQILQKLWEYQKQRKLTNAKLARELDIAEEYIYRWKKGRIGSAYLRIIEQFLAGGKI